MADGFTVRLARSGRSVFVPEGGSILFELLQQGIDVPFSCGAGVCGACEIGVVSGTPDHRDFVLSDCQRAAGTSILVCCSKSLSPELVLDL